MLFVDQTTKSAAEKALALQFAEYKQFKGKSLRLPVYSLAYPNCGDEIRFAINKLDFIGNANYSGAA